MPKDELIVSMYVRSRNNNNLIAGRFALVGLHQLCTKLFLYAVDKGL